MIRNRVVRVEARKNLGPPRKEVSPPGLASVCQYLFGAGVGISLIFGRPLLTESRASGGQKFFKSWLAEAKPVILIEIVKKTPRLSFEVKRVCKSHQKKVQELQKIVLTEN